ncbi:hypothetical protein ADICYQ_5121 [Cyclobacterium qasimii M12-11B]|uniref:Uncharacterized protein n=1 Tax=Cyclobacterium qasimii M12-11B TaxID=641524 RepID=S7V7F7_9BACT|nr:hypothetical protein ADICYQ_5121 [Cyclobacterium qasimii M12-11B]
MIGINIKKPDSLRLFGFFMLFKGISVLVASYTGGSSLILSVSFRIVGLTLEFLS